MLEATCIGCGCTDSHACVHEGVPCRWLRLDRANGKGVCSACPDHVSVFDKGRESEQAKADCETVSVSN